SSRTWPPEHVKPHRFYLHSGGRANSVHGDGVLSEAEPQGEPLDSFIYDPHDPVPTLGGSFSAPLTTPGVIPGPIEQSPVERRKDVLCYTTSPFESDVEISGPIRLHLFASTSARDTDFTAKLTHVYPDATSYNFAEGILRLSGRDPAQKRLVTPGKVYAFDVGLGHTSIGSPRGHRLRLHVSRSRLPQRERNVNT